VALCRLSGGICREVDVSAAAAGQNELTAAVRSRKRGSPMGKRSSTLTGLTCAVALVLAGCGGGGSSASSFCNSAKGLQAKYGANFDVTKAPNVNQAAADFKKLADSSPSAIKVDMQTMSDALTKIANKDTSSLQADSAKITAASTNVQAYLQNKCGISTTTST
jgi:hypothetical protein